MAITLHELRETIRAAFASLSDDLEGHSFWRHQREAVQALVGHLADPGRDPRASVVIPTGGGKTAIFCTLVNAVGARVGQAAPAPRIVMLVPNLHLIAQVLMEFRTRHPEVDIGYLASRPVVDRLGHSYVQGWHPTTVLTYALFMRLVASGEISRSDVDLIVMDEAHRGLSDLRRGVFTDLFPDTMAVAFSATPEFDEARSLNGLMGDRNLVYTANPQDLRDEGIIAPVANYVLAVRTEGTLPEDPERRQMLRRKAHVDETLSFLEGLVDEETGIRPLDKVTLFYGSDRAHASMFALEYNARFAEQGKLMVVLTGDDTTERLRDVVSGIARGEFTGIANAQLLTEGFDNEKVGLVVNAPTGSIVKVIQQSGRAQRLDRSIPLDDVEQTAFVVDTYLEHDGVIQGNPRWYFEALNVVDKAYSVVGRPVRVEDIDLADYPVPGGAPSPAPGQGDAPIPGAARTAFGRPDDDRSPAAAARSWFGPGPGLRKPATPRAYVTSRSVAAVRYLLRRRSLGWQPDPKTGEWLARTDFLSGVARGQTDAFFDAVEREFFEKRQSLALESDPIVRHYVATDGRRSPPVRVRMALMRSGAKPTVCYHASCVPDLIRISGAPMSGRPATEDWITRRDMIDAAGAAWSEANALMTRTYNAFLVEERLDPDAGGTMLDGAFVRMRRIEGAKTWVAYHRDDVPVVRGLLGIGHERNVDGEYTRPEIALRLGIPDSDKVLKDALETLRSQAEAKLPTQVNGTPVAAVLRYRSGRLLVHVVGDAGIDALSAAIDAPSLPRRNDRWALTPDLPDRTEAWLTRTDVYGRLRTTYRAGSPLAVLWERLTEAPEVDGVRTVDGIAYRFRLMRALNRATICLHEDDLERFRVAAGDPTAPDPVESLDGAELKEGWHTLNMAGPLMGVASTTPTLVNAWRDLADRLREHGEVVVDGQRVDMRMMLVRGTLRPCLDDRGLDWLAARIGRPRDNLAKRREDELGRADVAKALGMKPDSRRFGDAWTKLERDLLENADLDGVAARLTSPMRAMVIGRDSLEAFVARAGFGDVPAAHLDPEEVHARLRGDLGSMGRDQFQAIWARLSAEQGEGSKTYEMARFKKGRRSGWALREADYPRLLESLRPPVRSVPEPVPEEDWSEDWATLDEVLRVAGAQRHGSAAKDLSKAILERQETVGDVPSGFLTGVTWNGVRIPLRSIPAKGLVRFALARLAIPTLVPRLAPAPEAGDDWRGLRSFTGVTHVEHARELLEGIKQEVEGASPPASDLMVERLPTPLDALDPQEAAAPEPVPVRLRVGIRRAGHISSVYVHRDSWENLSRITGQFLPTLPPDPDYLSREEAFAQLRISYNAKIDDVFRRAASAYVTRLRLTGQHGPVEVDGTVLRARRVPRGLNGAIHFHADDVQAAAMLAGYDPEKPKGWLDRVEASNRCRVNGQNNPVFAPFWNNLTALTEAGQPVTLDGRTLRTCMYRSKSSRSACIHPDDMAHVIDALGFVTEPKTDQWIDKLDAASRLRTAMSSPRFAEAWNALMALGDARRKTVLAGEPVRFKKLINGSRTPYCIHVEDLPALGRAIGAGRPSRPRKDAGWVTEREFCEAHRTNHQSQPVINPLWDMFHEAAIENRSVRLATGTPRLAVVRHGSHDVTCIHADDLPLLRRHLGISDPMPAEVLAEDWRPRSTVANLVDPELAGWLEETWDDMSMTLVAEPDIAPPGIRLRVDINGAGVIMRVHKDDMHSLADWIRRTAPAVSMACR